MNPSYTSGTIAKTTDTYEKIVNPSVVSGMITIDVQWDQKDPDRKNGQIGGIKTLLTIIIDDPVLFGAIWGDLDNWRQHEKRNREYLIVLTTKLDQKRIYHIQCK